MKLRSNLILLMLMLVVFITSCSKKANIPVPADAAVVVHINGASLNSKLSWDEIKQSEWFKLAEAESSKDTGNEMAKKILNNPEASGIDIKSDAYIFIRMRGRGAYAGLTCGVKDEKAFADFVTKATEGATVEKDGSYSVVEKEGTVITWDSKRFLLLSDTPDFNTSSAMMGKRPNGNNAFTTDSLLIFAKETHNLSGSSSLGNNDKFASLMKEDGDVHFWMNAGTLYGNGLPPMLAITKASLLFDGNISAATLNFENGKIAVKGKSYFNKELAEVYKKHKMKNLDEEMLKKIPSGNVAAVIAFNYPPEGLKDFMKVLGVDGMVNGFLGDVGFSIDDFIKANKGDILFSVSDFTSGEKEVKMDLGNGEVITHKTNRPDAKILFATSVGDKPTFDKMVSIIQGKIMEEGMGAKMMNNIPFQLKDNCFIAGSDSVNVHSFGNASTDHAFISKIKGHPMGGYFDIQQFINGSKPMFREDSMANLVADQSLKIWQDAVFYGGEYKNDATESYFEINLVDKNTNSLKQLNNYLGFLAVKMHEEQKMKQARWDDMASDSSTVPVTPVEKK